VRAREHALRAGLVSLALVRARLAPMPIRERAPRPPVQDEHQDQDEDGTHGRIARSGSGSSLACGARANGSEALGQASLLEYGIGGVTGHDALVDDEVSAGDRRIPDVVITPAVTYETATSVA